MKKTTKTRFKVISLIAIAAMLFNCANVLAFNFNDFNAKGKNKKETWLQEEYATVGLGNYVAHGYGLVTENDLRKEHGLGKRVKYLC